MLSNILSNMYFYTKSSKFPRFTSLCNLALNFLKFSKLQRELRSHHHLSAIVTTLPEACIGRRDMQICLWECGHIRDATLFPGFIVRSGGPLIWCNKSNVWYCSKIFYFRYFYLIPIYIFFTYRIHIFCRSNHYFERHM